MFLPATLMPAFDSLNWYLNIIQNPSLNHFAMSPAFLKPHHVLGPGIRALKGPTA